MYWNCALSLPPRSPTVAPDQLGLDGFEARFHHGIEAPIFVKEGFELTLGRRVGCIFLGPCSVLMPLLGLNFVPFSGQFSY
jgi:hypothetical protein